MPVWGIAPPERYDHPYSGPEIVQMLTIGQIKAICGDWADACSWLDGRTCRILLPVGGLRLDFVKRHEEAHCNGWPPDHPYGRMVELAE